MKDTPMDEMLNVSAVTGWEPEHRAKAETLYQSALKKQNVKVVVLDDDPTGVQTVHGIHVYTHWDQDSIDDGFSEENPLFFILTNSRGLTAEKTKAVHRDIAERVMQSAQKSGKAFTIISRSDSTLRGHFPLETETLREVIESGSSIHFDGEIICPFFLEGGRFTIGNIHYVQEGEMLVPAARTEFAKDATFGYSHSDLGAWCEEKTEGRYPKESTTYIELSTLRACDADRVAEQLMHVRDFQKVVVNATAYEDVKVFLAGYWIAVNNGKRFMFRTAAAVPKLLGGIADRPLLTGAGVRIAGGAGGLIVVGSHVQKTTRQLEALRSSVPELVSLEFEVAAALTPGGLKEESKRIADLASQAIQQGRTVLVFTSRRILELPGGSQEDQLKLSVAISDALTAAVAQIDARPSFIIAKGGITSSDIGVKALGVRRALVLGQIAPGVPVWRTDLGSKIPNMPFVIFPGNVGQDQTLADIVKELTGNTLEA